MEKRVSFAINTGFCLIEKHILINHVSNIIKKEQWNGNIRQRYYTRNDSFRFKPKSGTAGSYGGSNFSFLRKIPTVLHYGYTNLKSFQWGIEVSFSPHLCQYLLLLVFVFLFYLKIKDRIQDRERLIWPGFSLEPRTGSKTLMWVAGTQPFDP